MVNKATKASYPCQYMPQGYLKPATFHIRDSDLTAWTITKDKGMHECYWHCGNDMRQEVEENYNNERMDVLGMDVVCMYSDLAWELHKVPQDWKKAITVPMYKGKKSQDECGSYGEELFSVCWEMYMGGS